MPKPDVLARIVRVTRVDPRWLIHGEGEKWLPAGAGVPEGRDLAEMLSTAIRTGVEKGEELLDARRAAAVRRAVEGRVTGRRRGVDGVAEEGVEYGPDVVAVPILGGSVAAGPGRVVEEGEIEDWAICYRPHVPHPEQTTAVRVSGESMEDLIGDGSLVGVDHAVRDFSLILNARPPLAVVRDPDAEGVIVRLAERLDAQTVVFRPWNRTRAFPSVVWRLDGEGESPIVGKVVWWYSPVR